MENQIPDSGEIKPANTVTVAELDELVKETFELRAKIEQMEAAVSEENKKLQALKTKTVLYLKELGRDKFASPFGTVSVKESWSVKLPSDPEKREAFYGYLKNCGLFDQLVSVNYQTLNSFYNQEMARAIEEGNIDFQVPGIGEAKLFESLTMRKGK